MSLIELTQRGDRALSEAEKKRERKRRAVRKKEEKASQPPAGM
jgi:hypothetical protein